MNNVTDQIKERLGVVDVVGEYIKLEKAGTNYKALCPFHNEKTPSFMVNPERNFWYCFGCQKGGDIFTFVQEMDGVEFRDALERLAERAGVELPKFDPKIMAKRSSKKKSLEILQLAARFYHGQLKTNPKKDVILKYLHSRKIPKHLVEKFFVGYAPGGWTNIIDFLKSKGYSEKEIDKTGLLVSKQGGGFYDRFRDRIMLPVFDVGGKIVGFSARVAPGGDETTAKYINTPQTEVYDKSAVLYGLHQAKAAIRSSDSVIVVEGNLDVIASHFAGVENVVAVSGTAMTPVHASILKRYTQNVKLCFDMDEAGQRATQKSIQTCLQGALNVEILLLPEGQKDVCDLVNASEKAWQGISQKGAPVMNYFFKKIMAGHNPNDVRTKKIVARDMLNIIKDVADPIEQSYWLKKLSSGIEIDEEVLTKILEGSNLKKEREQDTEPVRQKNNSTHKTKREIQEERLLGLFALYPNELNEVSQELDYDFTDKNSLFWEDLKSGKKPSAKIEEFAMKVKYIKDETQGLIENEIDPLREWKSTVEDLEESAKEEVLSMLQRDIKKAKDQGDEQAMDMLMKEMSEILKEENEDN